MSVTFRKVIFWPHLVAGIIAGLVIAIMSITGVVIAFEHELVDWADHERWVQAPAPDAPRLPIDELLARVRQARPEAKPSGVTVYPEPTAAVLVSIGRGSGVYVNPYTGEVKEQGAKGLRNFLHVMEEWHRWLGAQGDNRAAGRAITGASNAVFLFLAVSGLYLWWPRKWTWRTVRPTVWFRSGLRGKARDFNWHNVLGLWFLPVLVVLTATGMVISYKWASDLVYTLTGNTPPATQGPPTPTVVKVPEPPAGATPIALDTLFTEALAQVPAWENISVRLGGGPGGPPPKPQGTQALTFSIREPGAWPLFASTQFAMDPFTGKVLLRETFADTNTGRQARTWIRFLHTGEALGWVGQLIAALASLGGVVLVWTGFALSWRRFFPRRNARTTPAEVPAATEQSEPTA
ncbi:PepSY domain-containing protein [Vitiosangium sp. GDMCC 1.1324]|uniref:PepSY-associated TM helix domain-containing protein n=1 Tax=Vitiosangium sp. (strain GDMCC 1.1324) TaxID=2138576 RepID=UPI000D393DF2|nr:PepSY-associated TM helix domain-containing protein [Vitiosangium sp. GDMCC 1.1324]PTL76676.1 PepSY domain-containing protein [Vitiosangium sp. GDMCC 1.1324]